MNSFLQELFINLCNVKLLEKDERVLTKFLQLFYTFENELEPPSSMVAMMVSACGQPLPQVLSASFNTFGQNHGCCEKAIEFILSNYQGSCFYGFGHPKYKLEDPRVAELIKFTQQIDYHNLILEKSIQFSEQKQICLNPAGFLAAVFLHIGVDKHCADLFICLCRAVGLTKIYSKSRKNHFKLSSSYELIKQYNCSN